MLGLSVRNLMVSLLFLLDVPVNNFSVISGRGHRSLVLPDGVLISWCIDKLQGYKILYIAFAQCVSVLVACDI